MNPWHRYPLRTCMAEKTCDVCDGVITRGQEYFDAKRRRAHKACAENVTHKPDLDPTLGDIRRSVKKFEASMLRPVLTRSSSISDAARRLRCPRNTLLRLLEKHPSLDRIMKRGS